MNLELSGSEFAPNASEADLARCLDSFFNGAKDSFVILSHGQNFVQVSKSKKGEFIMERQDGSTEKHFRCSSQNLSQEQVRSAFKGFHLASSSWVAELPWTREILDDDSDTATSTPLTLKHVVILLVIVGIALAYSLIKTFA